MQHLQQVLRCADVVGHPTDEGRPTRRHRRHVGTSSRTGIWHETCLVRAGEHEAVYGNMPPYGLGRASTLVPLRGSTARTRLGASARR